MSIDVLTYNALNAEIKPLRTNVNALQCCIDTTNASISAVQSTISGLNTCCECLISQINADAVQVVANAGPNQAHLWCLIPTLPATGCSWTSGFSVCDTSGNFRCGASCSWIVPAGVTCARFQLWGAGAGTGSACCCGGSPIGGTGAYASVIIPVTAGNTYTLCAGCAFCCYACRAQNDVDGCASFVTGTGLTNFCAEGGEGNIYCEAVTRCIIGASVNNLCVYFGCICNTGTDFCWDGTRQGQSFGCCWDNILPMISSCKTYFGSATSGTAFGIRGSFGYINMACTGAMCVIHPPIYGFPTCSCCNCLIQFNYHQGCSRSAVNNFMRIPGAGGWAGFKCGGATNCAGDAGRMGMVCVSFR